MTASISEIIFGTLADGQVVKRYLLRNASGTEAEFTNLGAAWISFKLNASQSSLVLGCETFEAFANQGALLGATVGRYANRIRNGQFELNGNRYQVEVNQPPHHLHGGSQNFSRQVWHSHLTLKDDQTPVLTFKHSSPDGDAGFPGNLEVTVTITLHDDNRVTFEYSASTDQPTVINLTNHVYFNLAGERAGNFAGHEFKLATDRYLVADTQGIPTGEIGNASNSALDLTDWRDIQPQLDSLDDPILKTSNGFDHCYCYPIDDELKTLAHARHLETGVELTCRSTLPGMQFYTGNYLGGTPINEQDCYPTHGGFCFEPGFWTDSPNHDTFPECVIDQDNGYSAIIEYSFQELD